MEKTLRSVVCPDHNLRYDPAQSDGCARCMTLLRATASGRTPAPAATSKGESPGMQRTILTAAFVLVVALGWLHKRPVNIKAPEGAHVDKEHGFAIVVPPRWKVVDPSTVTYLQGRLPARDSMVAVLISDLGRLGPTVVVNAIDGVRTALPRESAIAEYEKGVRAGWKAEGTLEMTTDIALVDRIRAFHTSSLATIPVTQQIAVQTYQAPVQRSSRTPAWVPQRGPATEMRTVHSTEKASLDYLSFSGRGRTYVIISVIAGDRRADAAKAARAVADGFRVLERPKPYGSRLDLAISIALGLALLIVIRGLSKTA